MSIDTLKSTAGKEPVIVLFYGAACGPCVILKPVLRAVCQSLGVRLEEFNSAGEMETIRALGIRGVPTVCILAAGELKVLFTGNFAEPRLREQIQTAYLAAVEAVRSN
jgi:thioredoxin-like negative regulator of GroEL